MAPSYPWADPAVLPPGTDHPRGGGDSGPPWMQPGEPTSTPSTGPSRPSPTLASPMRPTTNRATAVVAGAEASPTRTQRGARGAARPGLDREPGDPARLDGRVDLQPSQRPPPGHRPRRQGTQAVPLPPAVASGPGRGQVRSTPRVRRRPARPADVGRGRTSSPHDGPGPRGGRRRAPPGRDPGAGRQRRVRHRQRVLRPDHAARRSRLHHPNVGWCSASRARAARRTRWP